MRFSGNHNSMSRISANEAVTSRGSCAQLSCCLKRAILSLPITTKTSLSDPVDPTCTSYQLLRRSREQAINHELRLRPYVYLAIGDKRDAEFGSNAKRITRSCLA